MYVTFPQVKRKDVVSIVGNPQKTFIIDFPTRFILLNNNLYAKIEGSLLGFGVGLEIQSKS